MNYPHLFSPYRIRNRVYRNRILSAPNGTKHKTLDGFPNEFEVTIFESRAKGGAAQVTTGDVRVSDKYGEIEDWKILRFKNGAQPSITEIAMAIKRHGALASVELNHPGCDAKPQFSGGRLPIAPSGYIREDGIEVLEMTEEQIEDTIEEYANAALFAKNCQFDMCTIHAGHGWLINQFLSPATNRRTDKWGGSRENRVRFLLEIIDRIRKKCGPEFLIETRMSVCDFVPGGITLEEGVEIAKLIDGKADLIQASGSNRLIPQLQEFGPIPFVSQPLGFYVPFAEAIKKAGVKTPVAAIGAITSPEQAEDIIASGKADFVYLGRALIADPDFPNKAKRGQRDDIIPCFRCEKCRDQHFTRQCAINPKQGRFMRMQYMNFHPTPRKVAVIGGGPAGMQAAVTAAEQGHDVTLYEKESELGGLVNVLEKEFLKREIREYKKYIIRKVNKLAKVVLNTAPTPEQLKAEKYDVIIAAVGAHPIVPPIPGIDKKHVASIVNVHDDGFKIGERVAIIGGGVSGCELAYELADKDGKEVILIEGTPNLFVETDRVSISYSTPLKYHILDNPKIDIRRNTLCTAIEDGSVTVKNSDGTTESIKADTVVYAVGLKSNSDTVDALWDCAPEFVPVGDCNLPRQLPDATGEAFFAAMDIC